MKIQIKIFLKIGSKTIEMFSTKEIYISFNTIILFLIIFRNISKLHPDLNLNATENWKIGKLRLPKKDNMPSKSDLLIIMSFSSLVNSKESCKYNNLDIFKDTLLDLFKENSSKSYFIYFNFLIK
jgi:hypothetical protein